MARGRRNYSRQKSSNRATPASHSNSHDSSAETPSASIVPERLLEHSHSGYGRPTTSRATLHAPSEVTLITSEHTLGADDDTLNEIVMSLDLTQKGTVGCSYYVARHEKLYLMEDLHFGGVDAVDACTLQDLERTTRTKSLQ